MRRILSVLPILLALSVVWIFRQPIYNLGYAAYLRSFPCRSPITYRIGSVSPEFGLSVDDFRKDIADAESVWEAPSGKNLFNYDPNGILTVNLIYDSRQADTDRLKSLGINIESTKNNYDALNAKYLSLRSNYDSEKAALDRDIAAYNEKKQSYDSEVAYWNSHRGASPETAARLDAIRQQLIAEADDLNKRSEALNQLAATINALVDALNRLALSLNVSAKTYNRIGDSRGAEFEEGVYERSAAGQTINIYQFESRTKLVRVLAHELGHALGLPHVDDPQAIMYRLNQGSAGKATRTDLDALTEICASHNLPFMLALPSSTSAM